jgi:hypothetical protein
MRTASELRAEVQRLRDLEKRTTDYQARAELRVLIAELEARACDMENGA